MERRTGKRIDVNAAASRRMSRTQAQKLILVERFSFLKSEQRRCLETRFRNPHLFVAFKLQPSLKLNNMTDARTKATTSGNDENTSPKPDPETLHTTDPQEHMKGPVSSLMQNTGEAFDNDESKEEADREKDKNM